MPRPVGSDRRHFLMSAGGAALAGVAGPARGQSEAKQSPPPDVGSKFTADGRVMRFAGNTVICHLPQQGPAASCFDALMDIYREAAGHAFVQKVALLPPSSYHMTVFGAANDSDRRPRHWPTGVASDAPISVCSKVLADRLRGFKSETTLPIRMRVDLAEPAADERPLTLRLLPHDSAENARLRKLRDRLAQAIGIQTPDHDKYRFHITLGYLVAWLTPDENEAFRSRMRDWREMVAARAPTIELGAPEFCTFDDMFAFHRQFYLA